MQNDADVTKEHGLPKSRVMPYQCSVTGVITFSVRLRRIVCLLFGHAIRTVNVEIISGVYCNCCDYYECD